MTDVAAKVISWLAAKAHSRRMIPAARSGDSTSNSMNPCRTISIDCEAVKCVFNTNYKCYAEHVDIKGCGACDCRETACATFKEK